MARTVTIPITDTPDCLAYYLVEYRLAGEAGYSFSEQYFTNPIVVDNLLDDTEYEFRITRYCCNGIASTPVEFTINTTEVPAPASITPTQDGGDVDLTWASVTDADSYNVQRATDSGFTTGLTEIYTGGSTSTTDVAVPAGTYWYRVRAYIGSINTWSGWTSNTITVV